MTSSSSAVSDESPTICVIGCGPGGMFFCHALERAMKQDPSRSRWPLVTVFERAGGPGGVWRSERTFVASAGQQEGEQEEKKTADIATVSMGTTTQMYEALWTNGPKEGIEFYDYSYQEHFGQDLPVYMPRQALLEYMVARCVRGCPDFFEKYVQFCTCVTSVKWLEEQNKFQVTTQNTMTRETRQHLFDKCIWAAGDNGRPHIPNSLMNIFSNFAGRVIHSTNTANFAENVRGKRVLIVGGAYSAEDLALMACKVGVEKVYVIFRDTGNVVTWTEQWPHGKVKLLAGKTPVACQGNKIFLSKVDWVDMNDYKPAGKRRTELNDIDTVILCTGYSKQFDMLDEELRAPFTKLKYTTHLPVPADWKMKKNLLSECFGEIQPADKIRWYGTYVSYPEIHNCLLISNPNMIFLRHNHNDYPILGVDAYAHLVVRYVTGDLDVPSAEEMMQANIEQALNEMQFPTARYYMDSNYRYEWDNSSLEGLEDIDTWDECKCDFEKYDFNIIAHIMQQANYPLCIGTYEELNEAGKKLYNYGYQTYYDRNRISKDEPWRTFRDTREAHMYCSLYTGTPAVPLPKRWLDIDEGTEDVLQLIREAETDGKEQESGDE